MLRADCKDPRGENLIDAAIAETGISVELEEEGCSSLKGVRQLASTPAVVPNDEDADNRTERTCVEERKKYSSGPDLHMIGATTQREPLWPGGAGPITSTGPAVPAAGLHPAGA